MDPTIIIAVVIVGGYLVLRGSGDGEYVEEGEAVEGGGGGGGGGGSEGFYYGDPEKPPAGAVVVTQPGTNYPAGGGVPVPPPPTKRDRAEAAKWKYPGASGGPAVQGRVLIVDDNGQGIGGGGLPPTNFPAGGAFGRPLTAQEKAVAAARAAAKRNETKNRLARDRFFGKPGSVATLDRQSKEWAAERKRIISHYISTGEESNTGTSSGGSGSGSDEQSTDDSGHKAEIKVYL